MGAQLSPLPRRAHQCLQPLHRTPPLQALKCSLKPLGVLWASFSHANHFSANIDFPMNSLKMTESERPRRAVGSQAFHALTTQGNENVFHELVFWLTKSHITMHYNVYLRNTWSEIGTWELALRIDYVLFYQVETRGDSSQALLPGLGGPRQGSVERLPHFQEKPYSVGTQK